jgi:hypothetical protein
MDWKIHLASTAQVLDVAVSAMFGTTYQAISIIYDTIYLDRKRAGGVLL